MMGHFDRPEENRTVRYYGSHRRLKPGEELVKQVYHLPGYGVEEGGVVGTTDKLGWNDIGDGGEPEVRQLVVGAEEAEPLLRHDEGDEKLTSIRSSGS